MNNNYIKLTKIVCTGLFFSAMVGCASSKPKPVQQVSRVVEPPFDEVIFEYGKLRQEQEDMKYQQVQEQERSLENKFDSIIAEYGYKEGAIQALTRLSYKASAASPELQVRLHTALALVHLEHGNRQGFLEAAEKVDQFYKESMIQDEVHYVLILRSKMLGTSLHPSVGQYRLARSVNAALRGN